MPTPDALVRGMVLAAVVTAAVLFFVTAPYGRHARPGWGPTVPARAGWFLMEIPSPACFLAGWYLGGAPPTPVPALLTGLWLWHYLYRAVIYPWRVRGSDMPIVVVALGATFNLFNGSLNGWFVARGTYAEGWVASLPFLAGLTLFAVGNAVNHHADAVLRGLRRPGERTYAIPFGGLYRWVSCPNYLGEWVQWVGFALASASPAAWGFALYTAANLFPRAWRHHAWYRAQFPDYPPERRAVLPFVW